MNNEYNIYTVWLLIIIMIQYKFYYKILVSLITNDLALLLVDLFVLGHHTVIIAIIVIIVFDEYRLFFGSIHYNPCFLQQISISITPPPKSEQ